MDSLAAPGHTHTHKHTYSRSLYVYGQFRSLALILRIRPVLPTRLPEQSTFLIFKMAENEKKRQQVTEETDKEQEGWRRRAKAVADQLSIRV